MKWKTREGFELEISDIEDSHLVNIIRYLRRNCESLRIRFENKVLETFPTYRGEMAQYYAENNFFSTMDFIRTSNDDDFLSGVIPQYDSLVKEAIERKLEVTI